MKILIHAHPQFSYITRAIVEISESANIDSKNIDLFIANGPAFLNHMLPALERYLKTYDPFSCLIKNTTVVPYPVNLCPSNFKNYTEEPPILKKLKSKWPNHYQNLINSVADSLFRGLSNQFSHELYHTEQFSQENELIYQSRLYYACALLDYYINLINRYSIDATCCSHGYYDFHVAFTIASLICGKKSYIIAGGNRNSYEITNKNVTDFGSEAPFIELAQQIDSITYHENILNRFSNNSEGLFDPKRKSRTGQPGLVDIFDTYKPQGKRLHLYMHRNVTPLIILPVFSEVNYHYNDLSKNLYKSRHSWFEDTVRRLSLHSENIYIRRHPDSTEYGESAFVSSIIQKLSSEGISIVELNKLDELSVQMKLENSIGKFMLPIMFGNSFALEATQINYPSLVVTACSATSVANTAILPKSLKDYQAILSGEKLITLEIHRTSSIKSNILLEYMRSTIGNSSYDRWAKKEYDNYFFFGKIGKTNSSELAKTIKEHLLTTKFYELKTESFTLIIPNAK